MSTTGTTSLSTKNTFGRRIKHLLSSLVFHNVVAKLNEDLAYHWIHTHTCSELH